MKRPEVARDQKSTDETGTTAKWVRNAVEASVPRARLLTVDLVAATQALAWLWRSDYCEGIIQRKDTQLIDGRKGALARRNKGFDVTHQSIIEAAVRIISEKGVEALSMAAVSRDAGINRTTLYYHFDDRDALIAAVKHWSSEQLTRGFSADLPRQQRAEHITRFVLENSALIKLFLDDFLAPGDIRERYPQWDALVRGIEKDLVDDGGDPVDAEVYCIILLTSAFIAPRVYRNSVRPNLGTEEVVGRFLREQMRVLRRDGLVKD